MVWLAIFWNIYSRSIQDLKVSENDAQCNQPQGGKLWRAQAMGAASMQLPGGLTWHAWEHSIIRPPLTLMASQGTSMLACSFSLSHTQEEEKWEHIALILLGNPAPSSLLALSPSTVGQKMSLDHCPADSFSWLHHKTCCQDYINDDCQAREALCLICNKRCSINTTYLSEFPDGHTSDPMASIS